jgi:hypothetical protein
MAGVGTHTITYTYTDTLGCPPVVITDTIVVNLCTPPFISQTYVYNANDRFIEVKNASDTKAIAPGSYYLALYANGVTTSGAPTSFIDLGVIPAQGVKSFKDPAAVAPAYAVATATSWPVAFNFDGDNDMVILTTSTGSNAYNDRVDLAGDATPWSNNISLVRISCALAPRVDAYDEQDWVAFTDVEMTTSYNEFSKTNAELGRHWDEVLFFEVTNSWNDESTDESNPDRSRQIQLNSNYCTGANGGTCIVGYGDFEACSLIVGSFVNLTITFRHYVKVQISVDVLPDGQLIVENQGSLVMVRDCYYNPPVCGTDLIDLGANSVMQATNQTVSLDGPYDYVYWSSPLSTNSTNPVASQIFSFGTTTTGLFNPSRFFLFQNKYFCDIYRQYNTITPFVDGYDDNFNDYMPFTHPELVASNAMNSPLIPGRGYATWPPIGNTNYSVTFTGEMNNGEILVPVYRNNSEKGKNANLVGNPYPSPIDLNVFFAENSTVIEPIAYVWTRLTDDPAAIPGPNGLNYTSANFSVYTTAMILNTQNNPDFAGGSTIATGQSFFVRTYKDFTGFTNAPIAPINGPYNAATTQEEILSAGNVVFKNKMRTTALNVTFSKLSNKDNSIGGATENTGDKLWVNLTDANNYAVQLGIYFKPTGSAEFVQGEDASTIHGRKYNFYTQSTAEDLIVDVQDGFNEEKTIPLGIVNVSQDQQQSFTISIPKKSGVFDTQTVYLEDTQLGVIHNLSQSSYSFITIGAVTEGRFRLRFTNDLTTVNSRTKNMENEVLLQIKNDTVFVQSLNKKIANVQVFDIYTPNTSGLLLNKAQNVNAKEVTVPVKTNFALLNVKIVLEDGTIINKKVRK